MRYLLDTNICIYVTNRRPPAVLARLERLRPVPLRRLEERVSGVPPGEDRGASLADSLPLDAVVARDYGRIRNDLEKRGSPLVTNNIREFGRVDGLRLANWAA